MPDEQQKILLQQTQLVSYPAIAGYNLGQEPWPQHTLTCSQIDTFIQNTANEFQNWQAVEYALQILYQWGLLPGNCPDAKHASVTSISF